MWSDATVMGHRKGHETVVKLLLEMAAELESRDNCDWTPLLRAAQKGNEAVAKLLLATNQVDVDSKDHYNSTPLPIAARMGHKYVVIFLLT